MAACDKEGCILTIVHGSRRPAGASKVLELFLVLLLLDILVDLVDDLGPNHFSSGFPLSVLSELNQVEQEAPDT